MKKLLAILLVICMMLMMVACGGDDEKNEKKEDDVKKNEANVAVIGDYTAKFNSAELLKDSYDSDAIAIHMTYTNNSKEATKFDWAFYYHAYQADAELEYAVVFTDPDSYDTLADGLQVEVEPGQSMDVTATFTLKDLTTPVRMTFSDLMGDHTGEFNIEIANLKGASDTPATEAPETDAPTTDAPVEGEVNATGSDWWLGDWYGTWVIMDGTGSYEECAWQYRDCCAYINATEDGNYFLSIWDEDYNDYNNNCLSETLLSLGESYYGDYGVMTPADGEDNYFYTSSLNSDSWYIDPAILEYRDTFVIFGEGTDENGESLEYMITLCKWGCEWDENAGQCPEYYESYFLPLMNEGAELPAVFEPNN